MSWSRAVWIEPKEDGTFEEYEMTIPANWVVGKHVFWPNHINVKRSFNKLEDPSPSWHQFTLIKLKLDKGIVLFTIFRK